MATYYEILHLTAYQSSPGVLIPPETLKSAYRKALLENHPDKQTSIDSKPKSFQASAARSQRPPIVPIDTLTLAFKTLATPELRAAYDSSLASSNSVKSDSTHKTGIETVDLDSIPYDETSNSWRRPCRCGSQFVVDEDELEKNVDSGEVLVGCGGCSLWVRVLFGVEDGWQYYCHLKQLSAMIYMGQARSMLRNML